jgi:hypothetical protein
MKTYQDYLEYHGSTTIALTRIQGEIVILRDWLIFDSVEDAMAYLNANQ